MCFFALPCACDTYVDFTGHAMVAAQAQTHPSRAQQTYLPASTQPATEVSSGRGYAIYAMLPRRIGRKRPSSIKQRNRFVGGT